MGELSAYGQLLRAQARAQASYRASFGIDLFVSMLALGFDVLSVIVLYQVTPDLGGFNLREAMVITGITAAAFATADAGIGSVERLRVLVRTGQLDALLLRPLPALPQLVLTELSLRKLSRVLFGVVVLAVAVAAAPIQWTPARAALIVLAPTAGAVFFGAVFVATASVSFWWVESGEVGNAFTYGGRDLAIYPVTAYQGWFRRIFCYGLGFATVAYYPALALLDRPDPLGAPAWLGWVSPLVAAVAVGVAALVWRAGIRHYRSTGS
ncbi:ABC transporter permease [Pilimelia columellifera]|uniref:ABC transporter permease n=1 Tax=Pilimelia columellifera subsp. columellifera TaxID=706583 RepID=A0ABN3NNZ8_9ACTN